MDIKEGMVVRYADGWCSSEEKKYLHVVKESFADVKRCRIVTINSSLSIMPSETVDWEMVEPTGYVMDGKEMKYVGFDPNATWKKTYAANSYGMEQYCMDVRMEVEKKKGCSAAKRVSYPLMWYCGTGRITTSELKKLVTIDTCEMADILIAKEKNTVDAIVKAIKSRIRKA